MIDHSTEKLVYVFLPPVLNLINKRHFSKKLQDTPHQLLTFRFALAVKASAPSITGTNQGIAQVCAFPLLVYLIVIPIIKTTSCK